MASGRTRALTAPRLIIYTARWWPLFFYSVLAFVLTWPLGGRLGTEIPLDGGSDVWAHEWTFWWLKTALLAGRNPYFTDLLFHPTGVDLTSHNIAWFNFALWFPLQTAFDSNTAFSLMYPLLFALNGYAMYLFAQAQLRVQTGAIIAGLVYGFWPYVLSQAGHPNMIVLFGLPLGLLYVDRTIRYGRRRDAVLAGVFFALLGIARWQLLVPAVYVVAIFVIGRAVARQNRGATAPLGKRLTPFWGQVYRAIRAQAIGVFQLSKRLAPIGVVMAILMAPLLLPLVIAQAMRTTAGDLLTYEPHYASDLLSYLLPNVHLGLWSSWVERLPSAWQFHQQEITFLGYTVMILAAIGIYGYRRKALLWLAIALLFLCLALGPTITIGQQPWPALPTPYRLVEDWFITHLMRRPDRFNIFLGLPFAMLAAMGTTVLQRRLAVKWFAPLALVIALAIVAEYSQAPYPLTTTAVPAWYQQLAQEPGDFAILGIPIGPYYADKYYMHYQIQHGKPIVGGHVSRRPPEALAYMEASPFLDDMLYRRIMDPTVEAVSHELRYLAAANVRYVVLNKHFSTAEQIEAWKAWLLVQPRYEDESVVVYATAPHAGIDFTVMEQLTPQVGLIQTTFAPAEARQGDLVTIDVGWAGQGATDGDYAACIDLLDTQQVEKQHNCYPLSPTWPTSRWAVNEVVRGQIIVQVDPHLAGGDYQIQLRLADGAGQMQGQPVTLGALAVTELPRTFAPPQPQQVTNLQLGESIALLGYDITVADTLQLTLYWQARTPIDHSYKVFVHLIDQRSGAILAQSDAPPRQWGYPTTWWEAGEVVAETIELPLDPTFTAPRTLRLGMYDDQTGDRLPLHSDDGATYPDNAFVIALGGE